MMVGDHGHTSGAEGPGRQPHGHHDEPEGHHDEPEGHHDEPGGRPHGHRHRPGDHPHGHGASWRGHRHEHEGAAAVLQEGTAEGIRALKVSVAGLFATSAIQLAVVAVGGSVALFADALHNLGDVLASLALWIALIATHRAADHRYTFGYQRFEDLAGLGIVLAIVASGGVAAAEAVRSLLRGSAPTHLGLGIAAGAVGFVGNEAVAQLKISVGRRIGSPALVAEGQHSRTDGLTSLGAVAGLGGVAAGARWADPVAGLLIAAVILYLAYEAGRPVLARVVDRVDPWVVEGIARAAASVEEVVDVHAIRARWAGRALYVLLHISLPEQLTLERAHAIGEEVRHAVLHALPQVVQVDVHIDPFGKDVAVYHERTAHHFEGH